MNGGWEQERPEDVPTGELPRSMQLLVDRRMVGTVSPGTRITAVGIYAILQVCMPGPLTLSSLVAIQLLACLAQLTRCTWAAGRPELCPHAGKLTAQQPACGSTPHHTVQSLKGPAARLH